MACNIFKAFKKESDSIKNNTVNDEILEGLKFGKF